MYWEPLGKDLLTVPVKHCKAPRSRAEAMLKARRSPLELSGRGAASKESTKRDSFEEQGTESSLGQMEARDLSRRRGM